jgi:hypothetical protein
MFSVLPAEQLTVARALEEAQVHAEQLKPFPKYPALHVHVDVSAVVLPEHGAAFVAYGEHVLHAEHVMPSP